jgi:hypothetical protein
MFCFTTYFDKNYISRGLALYDSLKRHCEQFELYVLCLDNITLEYFLNNVHRHPEVRSLPLNEIEDYDIELRECKKNRSIIEYYFTLSPCLPLYILKKYNLPHICSLDADIMFFSSPAIIFSNLKDYSVLITPHKFSKELKSREIYGNYNVSFQIFKNDDRGLNCLERWRKQCIDWCYYRLEDGKFADQKYLDNWIANVDGVTAIDMSGAGVAPWNINSHLIKINKKQVYIGDSKLIYFHFHGLRVIGPNLIIHGMNDYGVKISKMITRYIYKPYIQNLLSYKLDYIPEAKIFATKSQSSLRTILFQNNWLYFKSPILIKSNIFFELIGKIIIITTSKTKKWRKKIILNHMS